MVPRGAAMKGVVLWPKPDRHPLAGATNTNECPGHEGRDGRLIPVPRALSTAKAAPAVPRSGRHLPTLEDRADPRRDGPAIRHAVEKEHGKAQSPRQLGAQ